MDTDTRNMKAICGLLHAMKQQQIAPSNIDDLIATAERIYHDRKDNVR